MELVTCPGCARHVKLGASSCPFCGVALRTTDDDATELELSAPAPEATEAITLYGMPPLRRTDRTEPESRDRLPVPVYGAPPARDTTRMVPLRAPRRRRGAGVIVVLIVAAAIAAWYGLHSM